MTHDIDRRSVLMGALGAAALFCVDGVASAAQATEGEKANIKLVTDFVNAMSAKDLNKALTMFADDGVYRVTETAMPVTGPDGVRSRLAMLLEQSQVDWTIHETWAKGPMVINHRTDKFVNTTRPLNWEGVGVFFIANGKIKEWHDYTIKATRG